MENLEVFVHSTRSGDENLYGEATACNLLHQCCFTTTERNICVLENETDEICSTPLDANINNVRYIKYMSLYNIIFMADDYHLITFDPSSSKFNMVHSCVQKITALSWNHSETFLVAINNENEIYGYTFEGVLSKFIAVHKTHLDYDVPSSVYVGWGSHNTQFKGPQKKQAEIIEEEPQLYSDPRISWRGNGEQFVVNYWKDSKRFLKVLDCSLKPLYQSEFYPNLLEHVSFKGQGNCIACAARHSKQNKIVIFEKNCLVKTEFFVPDNQGTIQEILYHPELNILAVYSLTSEDVGYINIYMNTNAKWYLKQQLYFSPNRKVKYFCWIHTSGQFTSTCKLSILTSKELEFYTFRFIINRSPNTALVCITDGRVLNFTFFTLQIIPPPMASVTLTFEKPINQVIFHQKLKLCLVIDSSLCARVYDFKDNKLIEKFSTDLSNYITLKNILSVLHTCWTENNLDKNVITYKTENVLPYNDTTEIIPPQTLGNSHANLIYCTGTTLNSVFVEFALNNIQQLLVNKSVVCNNVTSIFIYKNYLLLTHASSKLYCIRLTPGIIDSYKWDLNKFYQREIEQGAKIVCVTDHKPLIILQLPRGNLETITCRLITIDILETLLSENKWEEALYTIRQEKLNWNLLIDLNPERFSQHIEDFVKAASTVSVLNSIVSEFSNENCLQKMYGQCIENSIFNDYDKGKILLNILNYINLIDPILNLVSIATIQIKHFTLKSALKSVCDVYKQGHIDICKKAIYQILLYTHANNVINATYTLYNLNFLSFIFNCCSEDPRVYEPEIEKLKELEPIELRFQMNVTGQNMKVATKYLIRCHSYDKQYISDFIMKNNSYDVAYESITLKNPNFKLVTNLYAKHLSLKGKHDEAALILTRAGLFEDSLEQYRKALNWHQVINLVNILNIEDTRKNDIISEMADNLIKKKRIDEAVLLYEHYVKDHVKAINALTDNKSFQKALCLAIKYNCNDLIDNLIKPAIQEYRESLSEKISELESKFVKYAGRLEVIRNQKMLNLKQRYSGDTENYIMNTDDDLYSDYASTISSRGSNTGSSRSKSSTMSSRNRRKEEKKKIDIREGGFYEDIALIRQLNLIIFDTFQCGNDVKEICLALTDEDSFRCSQSLHKKLCEAQEVMKNGIPKIWSDVFVSSADSTEPEVLAVIQNREDLEIKYRTPPNEEVLDENWKLLIFM